MTSRGYFGRVASEYAKARYYAALPSDEDVVAGLKELRAAHRLALDSYAEDRGDEPRPLEERQRDRDLVRFTPEGD